MTTLPDYRTSSAIYLRQMLKQRYPEHFHLFSDLFALGCLLHARGERNIGHGLMSSVVRTLSGTAEAPYVASLLRDLPGNQMRFACEIEPDFGISDLYYRVSIAPFEAGCNR
jgi:hypothetical protein